VGDLKPEWEGYIKSGTKHIISLYFPYPLLGDLATAGRYIHAVIGAFKMLKLI